MRQQDLVREVASTRPQHESLLRLHTDPLTTHTLHLQGRMKLPGTMKHCRKLSLRAARPSSYV